MSEIVELLQAAGLPGLGALVAYKRPEILKEIYGDLAKPGVAQVGKALETLFGFGNTILLPLQLANKKSRQIVEQSFEGFRLKLKDIPENEIGPIRPEVGSKILDSLSQTEDVDLRELFTQLLVSAAQKKSASKVHPSFPNIITNISGDEARLIKNFHSSQNHPFLYIAKRGGMINGEVTWFLEKDYILDTPELMNLDHLGLYLSNLQGLGLTEIKRDIWEVEREPYDKILTSRGGEFSQVQISDDFEPFYEGIEYVARRGIIQVTDYGALFQNVCLGPV